MKPGVYHHDVIELIRQIVFGRAAQMINRLPHRPMLWCRHHLALHQATGGIFRPGQGLLNRDAVCVFQHVQNGFLLVVFEVFNQIDNIVTVQLAHRLGQHLRGQNAEHFLAHRIVKFRQDLAIEFAVIEPHQAAPVERVDLL